MCVCVLQWHKCCTFKCCNSCYGLTSIYIRKVFPLNKICVCIFVWYVNLAQNALKDDAKKRRKKLKFKRSKQTYTGYTHKGGFAKWKENQKKRTHQIKQKATKYLMICLLDGIFPLKCTPSWAYTYTHTHTYTGSSYQ